MNHLCEYISTIMSKIMSFQYQEKDCRTFHGFSDEELAMILSDDFNEADYSSTKFRNSDYKYFIKSKHAKNMTEKPFDISEYINSDIDNEDYALSFEDFDNDDIEIGLPNNVCYLPQNNDISIAAS